MGKMKLTCRHEKRSILRKPTDAGNSGTAHADARRVSQKKRLLLLLMAEA